MKFVAQVVSIAAVWITACVQATAQPEYPQKPITVTIPYPPGGANDLIMRPLSEKLQRSLGQPVVLDYRPGANGNIAAGAVSRLAPDGYNLLLGNLSLIVHNPVLYERPGYNPDDFAPIAQLAESVMLVKVGPKSEFKTLRDMVDFARANPGRLNYGSPGNGSVVHLASELLREALRFDAVHIPMKGGSQTTAELLAGRLDFTVDPLLIGVGLGQLRVLAVIDGKRKESLPQVPTSSELGLPVPNANSWIGLFGPKGMPAAVVARLNGDIATAMGMPDVRERLLKAGLDARSATPEQFAKVIEDSRKTWHPVIKRLNLRIE